MKRKNLWKIGTRVLVESIRQAKANMTAGNFLTVEEMTEKLEQSRRQWYISQLKEHANLEERAAIEVFEAYEAGGGTDFFQLLYEIKHKEKPSDLLIEAEAETGHGGHLRDGVKKPGSTQR